jgi:S-adenosylmethionine synthetase
LFFGTARAARRVPSFKRKFFLILIQVGQRMSYPLCYSVRMMTEEQKREEQRKVERRVQHWKESVEEVKQLVKEWKKKNKR